MSEAEATDAITMLFGGEQRLLQSPYSVSECLTRLRADMDSYWSLYGSKPVIGRVGHRSASLMPQAPPRSVPRPASQKKSTLNLFMPSSIFLRSSTERRGEQSSRVALSVGGLVTLRLSFI